MGLAWRVGRGGPLSGRCEGCAAPHRGRDHLCTACRDEAACAAGSLGELDTLAAALGDDAPALSLAGWDYLDRFGALPGKDHEQPFPPPPKANDYRRKLYTRKDAGRAVAEPRVRDCGRRRVSRGSGVSLRTVEGRAHTAGVLLCGSVWACPTCASQIKTARATELQAAAEAWRARGGTVLLLTATIRHAWGDDLRTLRRGLALAWSKTIAGAPWKRRKARHGIVGYVRALEVTTGPNGWHPHVHALLFLAELPDHDPAAALEGREGRCACADCLRGWFAERWHGRVAATLGDRHAPRLDAVGVDLREARAADYLSKLGLEVAGALTKEASGRASRTPWQLLDGDERDLATFAAYSRGMKGARALTWSRGLRELLGLGEDVDDAELVGAPDGAAIVAELPPDVWDRVVRRVPLVVLLERAERGLSAVVALVRRQLGPEAAARVAEASARALDAAALARAHRRATGGEALPVGDAFDACG